MIRLFLFLFLAFTCFQNPYLLQRHSSRERGPKFNFLNFSSWPRKFFDDRALTVPPCLHRWIFLHAEMICDVLHTKYFLFIYFKSLEIGMKIVEVGHETLKGRIDSSIWTRHI